MAFAFAMTFGVASAHPGRYHNRNNNSTPSVPSVTVTNSNDGNVTNHSNTSALTGGNHVSSFFGTASTTTGNAKAVSDVTNQVGSNTTSITGVPGDITVKNSNKGWANNTTNTLTGTGFNSVNSLGTAYANTGRAVSGASIMNIVGISATTIK